jgi:hypothetical protein
LWIDQETEKMPGPTRAVEPVKELWTAGQGGKYEAGEN